MKVFISWSGDRSRRLAEILRRWLPSVLQAVRPYFSPDDIAKGSRWNSEIAKELEASRVGVLILTPENQDAPWLVFEAGALAKNLDRSKVCPILFGGLEPTDVKGPLVQFQAARFEREEVKRVVKMMNTELGDTGLASEVLDSVFDMWWPRLEEQVAQAEGDRSNVGDEANRTERDFLQEILALTRALAREVRPRFSEFEHPVFEDLLANTLELIHALRSQPLDEATERSLRNILPPLGYIVRHGSNRRFLGMLRRIVVEVEARPAGEKPGLPSETTEDVS